MLIAMVMAAAVAVGQRFVQEKLNYLSDLHLGRATVDSDAATDDIGAVLLGEKSRHGSMLMFRCLEHSGIRSKVQLFQQRMLNGLGWHIRKKCRPVG